MKDYYKVLGVPRAATAAEIKQAYRKLIKGCHPDVNPSPKAAEWSRELNEAYDVLSNSQAKTGGKTYAQLDAETKAALRERLKKEIRSNTYDPQTGNIVVSATRAEAMQAVAAHYAALFGNDPELKSLRNSYAIPAETIKTPERQRLMNAFFFWAAGPAAQSGPTATSPTRKTGRTRRSLITTPPARL